MNNHIKRRVLRVNGMSDYIKRENAKRAVWGCTRDTGIDEAPFEYAEGLLKDVPSEDVAPVVRCKDCKHRAEWNGAYGCDLDGCYGDRYTDGFCDRAERKDDE